MAATGPAFDRPQREGVHVISNSGVVQRPNRSVILLSKIKQTTMRLGSRTQAFFRKGEELEATGFETLPHDDPTLVPPKLGFRTFDRVPRNRAPMLIALLVVATGFVGLFGWCSAHDIPDGSARVASSVRTKVSTEWVRLKSFVASKRAAP